MNLIGANDSSRAVIEHIFLVATLSLVAGLFVQYNLLWRWDNLLYDAQLSFWTRDVPDDIIIVTIDDESLSDLGRWPWPRSIHADLIKQLEQESPKAIGLDIIFSEPDTKDPDSDALLAQAMQASGKVVLPVYMTQQSLNSYPIEALPLPELTSQAAALGHVHVDISDDGIARKIYLKEGIGEPYWMHYGLAVLSITEHVVDLAGKDSGLVENQPYSSMLWSREYPFLIPYAGPPGHFQQIGYSQVLAGNYTRDLFKDKIVLIGTSAEGLGDALPTPLSGDGGSMPGVEIVANVIDAVRNDLRIVELDKQWLFLITVILVAIPVLVYPYLNPVNTLVVLFIIVGASMIAIAMLLWLAGLWVPLSTILLFQFLSYPLWSWRRLVLAMRHINFELNQLSERQKALSVRRDRNIIEEIRFVSQFIPLRGWTIQDETGNQLLKDGEPPECNISNINLKGWRVNKDTYWAWTRYQEMPCRLGLKLSEEADLSKDMRRLLNSLISTQHSADDEHNAYVEDVLQAKIQQVQAAGSEYEELRQIIDDSLSGMADGVLICTSRGQIILSNKRAGWYLYGDDNADINGESLVSILENVHLKDGGSWQPLLQTVLFTRQRVLTEAQHTSGRDLLVELSPLRMIRDVFDGFVVNFSDISLLKASERRRNEVLNFLSHDLRSPLASMIAMIELAKSKTSINEMREMLDNMETNTHKTLHLAEQFLQLSRANATENINFYDVDFNSIALNAVDQIWGLSSKSGIKLEYELMEDEIWTHAEADMLERAILNLLSNAIKHSQAGMAVKLSVGINNNEIECCVQDHGTGISEDELPHLFEMFRRTQGAGVERIQGIGLGLAFVDAVARRHAGQVKVESKLGEGSCFCLSIPRIEPIDSDVYD